MPRNDEEIPGRRWRFDNKISLTILVGFLFQTATIVWWVAKADARIEALEQKAAVTTAITQPQADRLTRVEVKLEGMAETLTEIKQLLRRTP